jgi:tRNA A-37 threonylcarbamoyl transferase component Bud32
VATLALVFYNGRVYHADTSGWELIDSGGEADIYEARIAGRKFVVKVFTEKQTLLAKPLERIAEILRRVVRLRRKCGTVLPRSLEGRGVPVAVGALQDRAVMVFRYVEGFRTLAEIANSFDQLRNYLSENSEAERIAMARDVLRALSCLEAADIVHVDITTANAAYGSIDGRRWVYLFDLETAAIMDDPEYPLVVIPARDAHFFPVESLAELGIELHPPDPGELPIPLLPSKSPRQLLSWALWTPTWYGLQLVAYVYIGASPFQGLPSITAYYWRQVVEAEREKGFPGGWPPRSMVDLGFLDNSEYRELSSAWRKLGDEVVAGFYQVFVVDIAERRPMPSYTISSIV